MDIYKHLEILEQYQFISESQSNTILHSTKFMDAVQLFQNNQPLLYQYNLFDNSLINNISTTLHYCTSSVFSEIQSSLYAIHNQFNNFNQFNINLLSKLEFDYNFVSYFNSVNVFSNPVNELYFTVNDILQNIIFTIDNSECEVDDKNTLDELLTFFNALQYQSKYLFGSQLEYFNTFIDYATQYINYFTLFVFKKESKDVSLADWISFIIGIHSLFNFFFG